MDDVTQHNTTQHNTDARAEPKNAPPKIRMGLSSRLLILTITVIMLAEVLIIVPSISRYRKTFLEEHIARAHVAALSLTNMLQGMVNKKLRSNCWFMPMPTASGYVFQNVK
jgi:hypothetical protein